MVDKKNVAPDGGWGWVIIAAFAINNIIHVPIYSGFTLLFRNVFVEMQLSTIDITTILNVNSSFGFLLGLFNGPLLKTFGYKRVGMVASMIASVGYFMTSRAQTFAELIIFYGVMYSAGAIMTMASFGLAMNTYFSKRRNRASGICMTATGLGPVFMPLVMSRMMDHYGARGTALIFSALTLHSLAGTLLLHPVKWHYKKQEDIAGEEAAKLKGPEEEAKEEESRDSAEENDDGLETAELDELSLEPTIIPRKYSDASVIGGRRGSVSSGKLTMTSRRGSRVQPDPVWWSSSNSFSTTAAAQQQGHEEPSQHSSRKRSKGAKDGQSGDAEDPEDTRETKKKQKLWYKMFVSLFDLDLLRDPGYRAIWLGMSIAFTAEINFSLMTPIILGDRGWDVETTARIMSVIAVADIVFRFVSPFIGERLSVSPRYMYMHSILALVFFRFGLTQVESYWATVAVCVGLGVAKGFRSVYMTLVIPNYVSLEKLPSASGLQTVLNGIFLLLCGPLIGLIRDYSGSYDLCVHVFNMLTLVTITMWTLEYLFVIRKKARREQEEGGAS